MASELVDLTGYPLSCRNEKALQSFNDGALAYVSFRENGLPMIYQALELDDSIVLAHCLLVTLMHEWFYHFAIFTTKLL